MNQSARDYDLDIPDVFWAIIADAQRDVDTPGAVLRKVGMRGTSRKLRRGSSPAERNTTWRPGVT